MQTSRGWTPVELDGIEPPAGAYSRAIRAGGLIFVAGQVPRDLETGELLGEDVASQTAGVIGNLRKVLAAAGATLDDLVAVNVYLQNSGDWGTFDQVYRRELSPPYPTRTTVGADLRGILVEISAVAVCRDG